MIKVYFRPEGSQGKKENRIFMGEVATRNDAIALARERTDGETLISYSDGVPDEELEEVEIAYLFKRITVPDAGTEWHKYG